MVDGDHELRLTGIIPHDKYMDDMQSIFVFTRITIHFINDENRSQTMILLFDSFISF